MDGFIRVFFFISLFHKIFDIFFFSCLLLLIMFVVRISLLSSAKFKLIYLLFFLSIERSRLSPEDYDLLIPMIIILRFFLKHWGTVWSNQIKSRNFIPAMLHLTVSIRIHLMIQLHWNFIPSHLTSFYTTTLIVDVLRRVINLMENIFMHTVKCVCVEK